MDRLQRKPEEQRPAPPAPEKREPPKREEAPATETLAASAARDRHDALAPSGVNFLQRAAGNAAVAGALGNGSRKDGGPGGVAPLVQDVVSSGGQPLDREARASLEASYGRDLGHVRVHADARAAESARAVDAHAYTVGPDIVFDNGRYAPETPAGQHLIAHEVAHVIQQGDQRVPQAKLEVGETGDVHEQEAEAAATTALNGGKVSLGTAPLKLRRFKQVGEGGHAPMTERALTSMGLSPQAAHQGRLGNWERDLSQAITPGIASLLKAERVFAALNIIAIKEFGRGLDVKEFGTYDPVEHMDNPGDLRASDVFSQGGFGADRNADPGNPDFAAAGGQTVAGPDNMGYAGQVTDPKTGQARSLDTRYDHAAGQQQGKIMNPGDVPAFQVDQTGIPVYMNTSKEWLKRTLRAAALSGRTGSGWRRRDDTGKEVGETFGQGPRQFASGIHVMQDYYAHSNYVEISLNMLIREGALPIQLPPGAELDTQVHANDAQGNPDRSRNLSVTGLKGDTREVMTTGTFNLTDTAASLLEEAKDKLIELNPFKEKAKGPSPLMNAVLDYMDMAGPTDFSATGQKLADVIRPFGTAVQMMGNVVGGTVQGAGEVGGAAVRGATGIGGGFLRGIGALGGGWLNEKLGGDRDWFEQAAGQVEGAGQGASDKITGATGAAANKVREVAGFLNRLADDVSNDQHILRRLYGWWSGIDFLAPIKAIADEIHPSIRKKIEELQDKLREKTEELLGLAWNKAVETTLEGLNRVIAFLRARTNLSEKKKAGAGEGFMDSIARKLGAVGDLYKNGQPTAGIAPGAYTPPSHTQIAKDHGPMTSPVKDQHLDEDEEAAGKDAHGHTHDSAWLNPMASAMGEVATRDIGQKVAAVWNLVDAGQQPPAALLDEIDREIDRWFSHPADSGPLWRPVLLPMAQKAEFGVELLKQLRRATPGQPPDPHEHGDDDHDH